MGLLSKIGKGLKKIGSSVVKVFKTVVKPIRKALENKWVRGLLMATTFFTGAGAIMGAFQAGGLKAAAGAALKHVANIGIKMVRAPLDLISGGLKMAGNLASGAGMSNIGEFVSGLGQGLSNRVDSIANAATNVFKSAAPVTPSAPAAAADSSAATPMGASPVAPDANTFKGITQNMQPGADAMASPVSQSAALTEAKPPGMLSRAMSWAERYPELTKIGMDALAGATAQDPYDRGQEMRDTRNMWSGDSGVELSANPFTSEKGMSMLQQLRERNKQLMQPAG